MLTADYVAIGLLIVLGVFAFAAFTVMLSPAKRRSGPKGDIIER
jgi:hypothetical protein